MELKYFNIESSKLIDVVESDDCDKITCIFLLRYIWYLINRMETDAISDSSNLTEGYETLSNR